MATSMAKYRKRPVVVDAFRWTGGPDQEEDLEWIADAMDRWPEEGGVNIRKLWGGHDVVMDVVTPEGVMTAYPGYWIVRGVEGEICLVRPNIFEKTYEVVDETTTDAVEILHRRYGVDLVDDGDTEDEVDKPTPPEGRVVVEGMEGE